MTQYEFNKIKEKLAYTAGKSSDGRCLVLDFDTTIEYLNKFVTKDNELIIEELEKVAADLDAIKHTNIEPITKQKEVVVGIGELMAVFQIHISKLKGD